MDLSIVILNYKQKGLLKQCIKGIVASHPKLEYELIIVDNNSNDDSLAMVDQLFIKKNDASYQPKLPINQPLKTPPIKKIAAQENNGFAAGNNLGISEAAGQYVMILNPDVAVIPTALEQMVAYLDINPKIGIIGPRLINPDGSVQFSCRRFPNSLMPLYRRTIFGKLSFAKKLTDRYLMRDFDHESIA